MLDTIFVDGQKIGYQFNQKSQGSRRVKRRVHHKDGASYIFLGGNMISVMPVSHEGYIFQSIFEAVSVISQ